MSLYDTIYTRKSIRRYKMERLSHDFFINLQKFEQALQPFMDGLHYNMEIYNAMEDEIKMKGLFLVKAPYYLVFYGGVGENDKINAGYLMEQIVLFMAEKGIGSCYQGGARIQHAQMPKGLSPLMILAFGRPDDTIAREPHFAKRLPLSEICTFKEEPTEETRMMVGAARMAPSSLNGQPWRLMVYQNRIHVFVRKDFFHKAISGLYSLDIGVMLSHISITAEECWRDIEFTKTDQLASREYKNNRYLLTIRLV